MGEYLFRYCFSIVYTATPEKHCRTLNLPGQKTTKHQSSNYILFQRFKEKEFDILFYVEEDYVCAMSFIEYNMEMSDFSGEVSSLTTISHLVRVIIELLVSPSCEI